MSSFSVRWLGSNIAWRRKHYIHWIFSLILVTVQDAGWPPWNPSRPRDRGRKILTQPDSTYLNLDPLQRSLLSTTHDRPSGLIPQLNTTTARPELLHKYNSELRPQNRHLSSCGSPLTPDNPTEQTLHRSDCSSLRDFRVGRRSPPQRTLTQRRPKSENHQVGGPLPPQVLLRSSSSRPKGVGLRRRLQEASITGPHKNHYLSTTHIDTTPLST